jgi:hypothetical protein
LAPNPLYPPFSFENLQANIPRSAALCHFFKQPPFSITKSKSKTGEISFGECKRNNFGGRKCFGDVKKNSK